MIPIAQVQLAILKGAWYNIRLVTSKKNYTSSRLPVELVWSQEFPTMHDAFVCERQIKGWTRAKKAALIRGDFGAIHAIVKKERKQREIKNREAR
jgi:hypothetical protein